MIARLTQHLHANLRPAAQGELRHGIRYGGRICQPVYGCLISRVVWVLALLAPSHAWTQCSYNQPLPSAVSSGSNVSFVETQSITAPQSGSQTFTINSGASVTLMASFGPEYQNNNSTITLLPGFHAEMGSSFQTLLYSFSLPPCPVITEASPPSTSPNSNITIQGSNFYSSAFGVAVVFDNYLAVQPYMVAQNEIWVTVPFNAQPTPQGQTGTVYVIDYYPQYYENGSPVTIASMSNSLNFTITPPPPPTYTISGYITLNNNSNTPLTPVSISVNGTISANTNSSGYYTVAETAGTYTVTPSLSGYVFNPSSAPVTLSQSNVAQGFTAQPTISGTVTAQGQGLAGVTMTASNSGGTTGTATGGGYSIPVNAGGSYTITPSLAGYTFSPAVSQWFTNVTQPQTATFTATPTAIYTITGTVTLNGNSLSGVPVTYVLNSGPTTSSTSGSYSFSVNAGGSYTVTPAAAGYTFSPASYSFSDVTSNRTQSTPFAATSVSTYTVTGIVSANGGPLSGATVTVTQVTSGETATIATTTTSGSGTYSLAVNPGGPYVLNANLAPYTFTSLTLDQVTANVSNENFNTSAMGVKDYIRAGGRTLAIENYIQ